MNPIRIACRRHRHRCQKNNDKNENSSYSGINNSQTLSRLSVSPLTITNAVSLVTLLIVSVVIYSFSSSSVVTAFTATSRPTTSTKTSTSPTLMSNTFEQPSLNMPHSKPPQSATQRTRRESRTNEYDLSLLHRISAPWSLSLYSSRRTRLRSRTITRRARTVFAKEKFLTSPSSSSMVLFMSPSDCNNDVADSNENNSSSIAASTTTSAAAKDADVESSKSVSSSSSPSPSPSPSSDGVVTEDMVLDAVEAAEKAWEVALEARKEANALIDRAEEEAEAASIVALETEKMVDDNQKQKVPVTMQQLAQVDRAANASLDATSKVNRAVKASQEADRLEKIAETALQESERLLEEHLRTCPDSSLASEDDNNDNNENDDVTVDDDESERSLE